MTAASLPLTEPGRCKRLKAASSSDHDNVDELVMAARPFESRERYGHFLQVQHRFHGSLLAVYQDEQLNRWLPGLVELSRFAAVEQDLLDLGLPLPTSPQPVSAARPKPWGGCIAVKAPTWARRSCSSTLSAWGWMENRALDTWRRTRMVVHCTGASSWPGLMAWCWMRGKKQKL